MKTRSIAIAVATLVAITLSAFYLISLKSNSSGIAISSASTEYTAVGGNKASENESSATVENEPKFDGYRFIFFYKSDDDNTEAMKKIFRAAMDEIQGESESRLVDVRKASEQKIVSEFRMGRAPMPLALVIAPNGAVTGAFPNKFSKQDLLGASVSLAMASCIKALQDNKVVFVCVQNEKTTKNSEAMRGVRDFHSDKQYSASSEIVSLDPASGEEAGFLKKLGVDPNKGVAITVFLASSGIIGKYEGATDKKTFVDAVSGCGTSCESG